LKKNAIFYSNSTHPLTSVGRADALASLAAAAAPDRAAHHPRPRRGAARPVRCIAASGHHKAARAPSACTPTACVTFGTEVPPTRQCRLTSTGDRRRTSSWRGGTTRTCGRLCRASTSGRAPHRQDLACLSLDAGGHASSLDSVDALLRSAISRASSETQRPLKHQRAALRVSRCLRALCPLHECALASLVFALAFGFSSLGRLSDGSSCAVRTTRTLGNDENDENPEAPVTVSAPESPHVSGKASGAASERGCWEPAWCRRVVAR